MNFIRFAQIIVLMLIISSAFASDALEQSAAERYFNMIDQGLMFSRTQIPLLVASAEEAAERLVAGGKIYTVQTQAGFCAEAGGRAGGMMFVKSLDYGDTLSPVRGDVILFGIECRLEDRDIKLVNAWQSKGVYVIAFAADFELPDTISRPDMTIMNGGPLGLQVWDGKQQKLCPVDTLGNVFNLWAWTGEFTAACTRLGKMPIMYQSYGIEGGFERAKKYRGKTFHDDFNIRSIAPGVLGNAYLDSIEAYLLSFRNTQMDKLKDAALKCRTAVKSGDANALFIGHMFPAHFEDKRAPQKIKLERYQEPDKRETKFKDGQFVFFCGYQYPREKLLKDAVKRGYSLVCLTVQSSDPPEPKENIIYMNPGWPLADNCVHVPGYDVPILPASGAVNAAIYWAFLAQVYGVSQ